jgi:p-cumate 2,3-dioxygenase subunit alpha
MTLSVPPLQDLIIDDQIGGVFRIHRSSLTSPEILAIERERIFDRAWLYLGHDSEVPNPGDYRRRVINGRPLFFARGGDGQVRVFYNTCTHRGAMICRRDEGHADVLQCFYHAWTFDMQGRIAGIPDEEAYGPAFDREERVLKSPPRLDSYAGFYFISFNPHVEPLLEHLGLVAEWLDVSVPGFQIHKGTLKYTMRCNWKLLMENSQDAYHVPATHQTYLEYMRSPGVPPRFRKQPYERLKGLGNMGLPQGHSLSSGHCFIYPNAVWVSGPTLRTFWPVSPDELEVRSVIFGPPDEDPQITTIRLNDAQCFQGPGGFATPDDVEALESCQQGFAAGGEEWSDISRGMLQEFPSAEGFPIGKGNQELAMRTFWRRWHADLLGARERVPAPVR